MFLFCFVLHGVSQIQWNAVFEFLIHMSPEGHQQSFSKFRPCFSVHVKFSESLCYTIHVHPSRSLAGKDQASSAQPIFSLQQNSLSGSSCIKLCKTKWMCILVEHSETRLYRTGPELSIWAFIFKFRDASSGSEVEFVFETKMCFGLAFKLLKSTHQRASWGCQITW